MAERCVQCNREFVALYPQLWAYKRGIKMFCSWHCLRAYERKEEHEMARLKKDGTPAKKPGPKKAVEIQKVKDLPKVEIPEQLNLQGGVNYQLKVQEDRKKDIAWTIPAIRHCVFGEWYYDQEHNRIDWRTPEGDEISFSPDGWKQLINDVLPDAMKRLGV